MSPDEIRGTIVDFIAFVEGRDVPDDPDGYLALLLDKLALASHFAIGNWDKMGAETEEPEYKSADYDEIGCRFPDFGYFEIAFPFSEGPGDTELVVADAIDALTDIYNELTQVVAIWEQLGANDALAQYRQMYDIHWHLHLRELQLYLHARRLGLSSK